MFCSLKRCFSFFFGSLRSLQLADECNGIFESGHVGMQAFNFSGQLCLAPGLGRSLVLRGLTTGTRLGAE